MIDLFKNIFNNIRKSRNIFILLPILGSNLLVVYSFHLLETSLHISKPDSNFKEDILSNLNFYIFFIILFAPFLEEFIFRYPLKKSRWRFISILLSILYIVIFQERFVQLTLGIYLIMLCVIIYFKKNASLLIICFSILVFTLIHLGNYEYESLMALNKVEIILLFTPQLLLGITVTLIRLKYSFKGALFYHCLYNAAILFLGLLFD